MFFPSATPPAPEGASRAGWLLLFNPDFLVVALGLDTAKDDPTGTWMLVARDFETNGRNIGALGLPTLVVQEGGYRVRPLGKNARNFFVDIWSSAIGKPFG